VYRQFAAERDVTCLTRSDAQHTKLVEVRDNVQRRLYGRLDEHLRRQREASFTRTHRHITYQAVVGVVPPATTSLGQENMIGVPRNGGRMRSDTEDLGEQRSSARLSHSNPRFESPHSDR